MISHIEVNCFEINYIEDDAVRTTTRELLDFNGEVALTLSLPTGTMDVLVTKKEGYTRNSKEPKDLSEALSMPDAQQWKDAVIKELTSLKDMGTYRIASLPPRRKAVEVSLCSPGNSRAPVRSKNGRHGVYCWDTVNERG